ncbi:hypothetical protein [Candidatus Poriferisocius sp.]|uniref:hypothetical protein n=1 Tax=Candidatus Poriferisocius sp. TaxID=3101276 RepID=UPI003B5C8C90
MADALGDADAPGVPDGFKTSVTLAGSPPSSPQAAAVITRARINPTHWAVRLPRLCPLP